MIHEDERRTLEDFPEAKLITAKQDCVLGDHYHKIKTEKFIFLWGEIEMTISEKVYSMDYGFIYTVHPNELHSFKMKAGSSMIGLCSHPYDPTDDYK